MKIKNTAFFIVLSILVWGEKAFSLIDIPVICPPNCVIIPELPDEYKVWNVQFETPSPAGFEPGEKMKLSFRYEAVDSVRFTLNLDYTGCGGSAYQALNAANRNYFPSALSGTAEFELTCTEPGVSDSIQIKTFSKIGIQHIHKVAYKSFFQVDSLYNVFVSPVKSDLQNGTHSVSLSDLNTGDTLYVKFKYTTNHTENVYFAMDAWGRNAPALTPEMRESAFVFEGESYSAPGDSVTGKLIVKQPGPVENFYVRLKTETEDTQLDVATYAKDMFFSDPTTSISTLQILQHPDRAEFENQINFEGATGWETFRKWNSLGEKVE